MLGMAIHFVCDYCTQRISVDESKAREKIECPHCNFPTRVPAKSTHDPQPSPPLPPPLRPTEERSSDRESQPLPPPQPAEPGHSAKSFHAMRQIVKFIFPKRIHRLSFLVRALATNLLCFWLMVALSSSHVITPTPVTAGFEDWYYYVALLALGIYTLLFVVLPRLRDTNMSGWWVLLSLVPAVYGFLCIILVFRAPQYHFEGSSNTAEQT